MDLALEEGTLDCYRDACEAVERALQCLLFGRWMQPLVWWTLETAVARLLLLLDAFGGTSEHLLGTF